MSKVAKKYLVFFLYCKLNYASLIGVPISMTNIKVQSLTLKKLNKSYYMYHEEMNKNYEYLYTVSDVLPSDIIPKYMCFIASLIYHSVLSYMCSNFIQRFANNEFNCFYFLSPVFSTSMYE